MITEGVAKRVLPNGLTVLVKENHSAPVVAIVTYVKAGYYNEPDRLVGISHLIEHMFFKGTRRRGVGEIARETKSLGGYLNASTIYDHTLYYTVLPSRSFARGLDIQADALMNSVFDPAELQKETEVVIQEAKRKLDSPSAYATEKLFELAFEKHRMRRWRIGTETGLRALAREDFLSFYKNLYRPENIVLVVVGDVNTEEALRQVENQYGSFPKGELFKETSPAEPPQRHFKFRRLRGDITETYFEVGYHTVPVLHEEVYALEILSFVLGSGRSSRLNQQVKETKRLVNTISSYHYANQDLGYLNISATLVPENLQAAEDAIFIEIERLKRQPVSAEELQKARNALEMSYVRSMETAAGLANVLAYYEALGDYRLADTYLERLTSVTETDIQRVAATYLELSNCSVLEYVPEGAGVEEWDADSLEKRLRQVVSEACAESDLRPSRSRGSKGSPLEINRPVTDLDRPVQRLRLSTGATLLVKESHHVPLVSLGIFLRGGRLNEKPQTAGITQLMLQTALKGTARRNASQIASEIEGLGSSIHTHNDADYFGYSLTALTRHAGKAWQILGDVVREPRFPEEEVEKERQLTIAAIRRTRDDMFRYPIQLCLQALFQNHPYALPGNGLEETVAAMIREDLLSWHRRHLSAGNLLVAMVGDIRAEEAVRWVEGVFADLEAGRGRSAPSPPAAPAGVVEKADSRHKAQTALALGFAGPPFTDDTFYPMLVLQNIASGLGGRFFEELRGRQGLAYTVAAFEVARWLGGAFLVYIATSPEKEEVARKGLLSEIGKLVREPVTEQELQQAKQYTVGVHEIGMETLSGQTFQYVRNELLGRGIEEVAAFAGRVEQVGREQIQRAAAEVFDMERFAVGVVRGTGKEVQG